MSGYIKKSVDALHDPVTGKLVGMYGADGKEYIFPLVYTPTATENYVNASGTPGNATIHAPRGRVAANVSQTALVVTNNLVNGNTYIGTNLASNDATAVIKSVVPTAGSFTINLVGPTAQCNIDFVIIN